MARAALAKELSHSWHELGGVLASRRLQASLHTGTGGDADARRSCARSTSSPRGTLRVGELADRVGIDDTTATRLVDRLEATGARRARGSFRATAV